MADRHFTRAQVEARTLEIHKVTIEHEKDDIEKITFPKIEWYADQKVWMVEWKIEYKKHYLSVIKICMLFAEEKTFSGNIILTPLLGIDLPSGATTVEEEDKLIQANEQQ